MSVCARCNTHYTLDTHSICSIVQLKHFKCCSRVSFNLFIEPIGIRSRHLLCEKVIVGRTSCGLCKEAKFSSVESTEMNVAKTMHSIHNSMPTWVLSVCNAQRCNNQLKMFCRVISLDQRDAPCRQWPSCTLYVHVAVTKMTTLPPSTTTTQ